MFGTTTHSFSKENFESLVKAIENQPPPNYEYQIIVSKESINNLDSNNPLILDLQKDLKKQAYGKLIMLSENLAYAYNDEILKKTIKGDD